MAVAATIKRATMRMKCGKRLLDSSRSLTLSADMDSCQQIRESHAAASIGGECHWCRREAPCECMSLVRDGGPLYEEITGTFGWSHYPERCMCTCGGCQA